MTTGCQIGQSGIARHVWRTRYRHDGETSLEDSFRRVARALAGAETTDARDWAGRFLATMCAGQFIPGGRILANAGAGGRGTLFNCFAWPPVINPAVMQKICCPRGTGIS